MTESLSTVTTAQITYAARDSDFDGFAIKEGDYLALEEGRLFGTDGSLDTLLHKLAEDARRAGVLLHLPVLRGGRDGGGRPKGRRPVRGAVPRRGGGGPPWRTACVLLYHLYGIKYREVFLFLSGRSTSFLF